MNYATQYFSEVARIALNLQSREIEEVALCLSQLTPHARIFFLGLGGSAANASHAVNDFRKLCGIESYCPSDNIAELTAIANDLGWQYIYREWLKESHLGNLDALFILSVGGGKGVVSLPLIEAIDYAKSIGTPIFGIVGRDGGITKLRGDHVIVIPTIDKERITPHTEAFQSVILHLLVSHPLLQMNKTKW